MFKAMLALCAVAVVFPQSTQDRPDLARDLTQLAKTAFEAADARKLDDRIRKISQQWVL